MTALAYGFSKLVCWIFLRVRFGLEVYGREHVPRRGAYLIASNHVSFLDPVVAGVAAPRRLAFIARADLFRHGLLGAWLRSVGAISVRRGEADPAAIRAAVRTLRNGRPMALFPEGGRQFSGEIGQARRGVGLLAMIAKVPIVPVYLHGTYAAMSPHDNKLRRAKIRVAFGPPIDYTSGSVSSSAASARDRQEALARAVTDAWQHLHEQLAGGDCSPHARAA